MKTKSKKPSSVPEYSSDALEAIGGIRVIGSGFIAKLLMMTPATLPTGFCVSMALIIELFRSLK